MDLHDYEPSAQPIDGTPRPNASQTVAARRRRQPAPEPRTPTTAAAPTRLSVPFGVVALLIILLMIGMASYQLSRSPARPLQTTPARGNLSTSAPAAVAAPSATPTSAPEAIASAYAAPDGARLGPVDLSGEMVLAVARAGADWVQLKRPSGDRVWFRRADLPSNLSVPDTLPDLSPRSAAPAPFIAPQTSSGQAAEQPAIQVEQPPAVERAPASSTGQKEAPARADAHATAVARLQLPPPAR